MWRVQGQKQTPPRYLNNLLKGQSVIQHHWFLGWNHLLVYGVVEMSHLLHTHTHTRSDIPKCECLCLRHLLNFLKSKKILWFVLMHHSPPQWAAGSYYTLHTGISYFTNHYNWCWRLSVCVYLFQYESLSVELLSDGSCLLDPGWNGEAESTQLSHLLH